jgi:hypothetical protein
VVHNSVDEYLKEWTMLTAVKTTIQAIVFVVQVSPVGTNLGLANLLWAMVSGAFLSSRGAIFPALQLSGLSAAEIRRSWSAMRHGSWHIDELLESWGVYVARENGWRETRHEGLRVVSIDLTGFWRPRLQGWLGKHYHSLTGRALSAVVFGVITHSGQVHGKRVPLLRKIVRCQPEQTEADYRAILLSEVARLDLPGDVKVLDAGFKLSDLTHADLQGFVLRMQSNCTARRSHLPDYKGRGAKPKYGALVRPLARTHRQNELSATSPDQTATFQRDGRTIQVAFWHGLVTSDTKVVDVQGTFSLYVFTDPRYTKPLVLATDLDLQPETVLAIYLDRWPVEHPPLAAKQMVGLHRQFVFAPEACFRLPELALLAGSILAYVAAVSPPISTGFWDRQPQATPGRLRRLLAEVDFPNMTEFDPELRKKASVTDHLPKGVDGHRRKKRAA